VRLFDKSEMREVIKRMFVMQTKTTMSGGPRIGEI
jgi:hypothetical protein